MRTHSITPETAGALIALPLDRLIHFARSGILLASCAFILFLNAASAKAEEPIWFDRGRLTPQARELLNVLQSADTYGLRPEDYQLKLPAHELRAIVANQPLDLSARERFDAALTSAASKFLEDIQQGRVSPRVAGFDLPSASNTFDVTLAARQLALAGDVHGAVAAYEPRALPYRLLKQALAQYRNLAAQENLQNLPPLPKRSIESGDEYAGARELRTLLAALGDLEREHASDQHVGTAFDETLAHAIRNFQRRHGLEPDGVLGRRTFAALAVPLARRVLQIELTLERWRWTTALPRPDLVVNIPQFFLFALPRTSDADSLPLEMPVIVGQNYSHTRTPIFVGEIQHVIFQPFWDVPSSITRRELLPLIRKDPSYLGRHHMEIVSGAGDGARAIAPTAETLAALEQGELRLRQRPGPDNALGSVKFVFPNPYNVYLHATPQPDLFERASRAFSHGCIRVSQPAALAAYVLENAAEKWTAEAIEAAMCDPRTRRVNLEKPVRVMILYGTAVATRSSGVLFFEDIYGHDRVLESLLERDGVR